MAAKVKWDRGAWWVFTHFDGRRKKKRIGPMKADKRVAEQIARKVNAALALGTYDPDLKTRKPTVTVAELASRWFRNEIELPIQRGFDGSVAPKTADRHRTHLDRRILPVLADRPVEALGVSDVQELYEFSARSTPVLSQRTIEMTIGTLGRVLAYAEAQELVTRNVVASWKRARGRRRNSGPKPLAHEKALDSEELERFLSVTREQFAHWYLFVLFLADTGARLGEASALRWIDVDFQNRRTRIARSFSDGQYLSTPKTGRERIVELSGRLAEALEAQRPDLFGDDDLVFPSESGGFIDPHNFRARVFRRISDKALGRGRGFSPHGLRHTFATLHLARGSNLKWIQAMGGWASAKLLLDLYGHYLATESSGYADALSIRSTPVQYAPERPQTAPRDPVTVPPARTRRKSAAHTREKLAPRGGLEPPTRGLEGRCSIQLSYRGAAGES